MFALVSAPLSHAWLWLPPPDWSDGCCWSASRTPFVIQPQSLKTQTHFSSHVVKLPADFIDLAVNQLVNYLISKALWVSAELPPSLRRSQVSLNHQPSSRTHTFQESDLSFQVSCLDSLDGDFCFLKLCAHTLRSSSVARGPNEFWLRLKES